MSPAGSDLLDCWIAGTEITPTANAEDLRRRLLDAGMMHPVLTPTPSVEPAFIIPVHGDVGGLNELLRALRSEFATERIVVVDDASPDPSRVAHVAAGFGAELVRQEVNTGPGEARNSGWCSVLSESEERPEVIVFVDADAKPEVGAINLLLAHFSDDKVAAVAPRVMAQPGITAIAHYEADNSPLDMGDQTAVVATGSRVSYVPTAALAIRAEVVKEHGGFASMRFGEDVDLIWRMLDVEQLVRYVPQAVVHHRNRASLGAMARQRFGYGSAAALLARSHRDKIAPLQMSLDLVATTLAGLFGAPAVKAAALAVSAVQTKRLADKLEPLTDKAPAEAARLRALGHGYAVRGLGSAATRSWAPLMMLTRRSRRALAIALVGPAVWQWIRHRPATDPVTHTVLRAVDHGSYCAGVWAGAWRERSVAALLPDVRLTEPGEETVQ